MRQILRNRALSVLFFATALLAGCGETAGNTPEHPTTEQITAAETEMATAATETATAAPLVTTETTSASTSAETATASEDDPFRSIAGEWYLDGDPDTAHLSIQPTGTFTAYYATGNVENTGYIQYETEEIGGMLSHWYLLYTDDGAFYLGFRDDGSAYKLELFVGNGADPRYVRLDGTGGIADDGRGIDEILASEAYLGIWGCGRATLQIAEMGDGTYQGRISWAESAFVYDEWIYPLIFEDATQTMVCSGGATKTRYTFTEEGVEPEETVCYTDGSGSFSFQDGVIYWQDDKEHSGEDMEFQQ